MRRVSTRRRRQQPREHSRGTLLGRNGGPARATAVGGAARLPAGRRWSPRCRLGSGRRRSTCRFSSSRPRCPANTAATGAWCAAAETSASWQASCATPMGPSWRRRPRARSSGSDASESHPQPIGCPNATSWPSGSWTPNSRIRAERRPRNPVAPDRPPAGRVLVLPAENHLELPVSAAVLGHRGGTRGVAGAVGGRGRRGPGHGPVARGGVGGDARGSERDRDRRSVHHHR